MKMKKLPIIIVLFLTVKVFALDPLGPPLTTKNKDQFIAGFEYLTGEMDLHADNFNMSTPVGTLQFPCDDFKDMELNRFHVNILTMFGNNYDIFLRLGLTYIDPDRHSNQDNLAGSIGDSDSGFTYGAGVRATLFESNEGKVDWGFLAQFSYAQLDFDDKTYVVNGSDVVISKTTLDMLNIQIAAGPTYQLSDSLCVYGGPFLNFLNGEVELSGKVRVNDTEVKVEDSSDIEELSEFGGFVGLSTELAKNTNFNIEFQMTDDAQAIGFRLIHRF